MFLSVQGTAQQWKVEYKVKEEMKYIWKTMKEEIPQFSDKSTCSLTFHFSPQLQAIKFDLLLLNIIK